MRLYWVESHDRIVGMESDVCDGDCDDGCPYPRPCEGINDLVAADNRAEAVRIARDAYVHRPWLTRKGHNVQQRCHTYAKYIGAFGNDIDGPARVVTSEYVGHENAGWLFARRSYYDWDADRVMDDIRREYEATVLAPEHARLMAELDREIVYYSADDYWGAADER
jgi:hypothetical protein